MLQFGASLTDDTSSVNYNRNMFIIQATGISYANAIVPNLYVLGVSQCAYWQGSRDVIWWQYFTDCQRFVRYFRPTAQALHNSVIKHYYCINYNIKFYLFKLYHYTDNHPVQRQIEKPWLPFARIESCCSQL
jgi:hypothetical protein